MLTAKSALATIFFLTAAYHILMTRGSGILRRNVNAAECRHCHTVKFGPINSAVLPTKVRFSERAFVFGLPLYVFGSPIEPCRKVRRTLRATRFAHRGAHATILGQVPPHDAWQQQSAIERSASTSADAVSQLSKVMLGLTVSEAITSEDSIVTAHQIRRLSSGYHSP